MRFTIGLVAFLSLAGCSSSPADEFDFKSIGNDIYAAAIPADVDPAKLKAASKARCGDAGFCKVMGWTDATKVATGFPMTEPEVQAMSFAFSINRESGLEEAMFNCDALPQAKSEKCLAKVEGEVEGSGS